MLRGGGRGARDTRDGGMWDGVYDSAGCSVILR
jgi:hypothetical protein